MNTHVGVSCRCATRTERPGYPVKFLHSKQTVVWSDEEVAAVSETIRTNRLQPSWKTRKAHIQHVQEIQERKANAVLCPKCGSEMILRTAKKGDNAGKEFWGCSRYPKCRSVLGA